MLVLCWVWEYTERIKERKKERSEEMDTMRQCQNSIIRKAKPKHGTYVVSLDVSWLECVGFVFGLGLYREKERKKERTIRRNGYDETMPAQ